MATARVSIKGAALQAKRDEKAALKQAGLPLLAAVATDSFINFAHKLGVGADNVLSSSTYGFNPISRNRVTLEWMHRGSWLAGTAVDLIADDMTRAGIDYTTELPPDESEAIDNLATVQGAWNKINSLIKWGRLYGGAIGVLLIDGQDMRTPLRMDTVAPGQFKGLLILDRWMVEPTLDDLVTDFGPDLGQPRYYRVNSSAPALKGSAIHHSRLAFRVEGIELPYQQRLTENMWGISVIERLYDRMIAFDLASTGMAQLINKAYLRTLAIKDLRQIVAAGGQALAGLTSYMDLVRRYQGIEGITLVDGEDTFETQQHSAMSGMSEALMQIGQQLAGALQIPLVRLFGQSPAGLNSTGESDLRMFYDHIQQEQMKMLHTGVLKVYKLMAINLGIKLPPNFGIKFKSLYALDDTEKATIAKSDTDAVIAAYDSAIIGRQTALKELRQSSRVTGMWTNITTEMIEAADDEIQDAPSAEEMLAGLGGTPGAPGAVPGLPAPKPDDKPGGFTRKPIGTGMVLRRPTTKAE